ncbi:hypothetical protein [Mesoflavibacter sp. CH_XMU1404-2]|uniref:hypothetical protein n=1 Tax=Mesoflavibacter sp. CH_XMU1404-2 TaxID=3107766 RepID=UPI00300AE47D
MKELLELPTHLLSTKDLAKLLMKAYQEGIKDYANGELKGKSIEELKSFVNPKFMDIILKG